MLGEQAQAPALAIEDRPASPADRQAMLETTPATRNPDTKDLFYVQTQAARLEARPWRTA
ncbi:MAG: hypothetical protein KatS3mg103_0249 [Phycisphaerales bacterium]|nr:MAG: hypothetical protein KatS3mg103_0249 [Phycisphaerales bacterium]